MDDPEFPPATPVEEAASAPQFGPPTPTEVASARTAERLRWSIDGLHDAVPELSVRHLWSRRQLIGLAVFAVVVAAALLRRPLLTASVTMAVLVVVYGVALWFRIDLARRSGSSAHRIEITDEAARAVPPWQLPLYSVLVPAYREPEVIKDLVANLAAIDYPADKLDVKLLLEEDDADTIEAAAALELPSFIEVVLVPAAEPRTKPKACNFGLLGCRGTYVTIYDAEDRPDPLQLRRVVLAFAQSGPEVACIQAELAYFNADENLLTRWFAVEYSMWFTQFLTGLSAADAPIPLGGTSNHIRTDVLVDIGAWDPYNVTEDADLGIRLYRCGYRVAIVNSVTYEEANNDAINWVKQRSRWYKGYLQTWLVHMRQPRKLLRDMGFSGFLRFNAFVGGTPALAMINPISWGLVLLWFTLRPAFVEAMMWAPAYYVGLATWILGNASLYYLTLIGAYEMKLRRIFLAVLLLPLYWVLMSLAAWKAALQLVINPAYWEKTTHGLTRTEPPAASLELA